MRSFQGDPLAEISITTICADDPAASATPPYLVSARPRDLASRRGRPTLFRRGRRRVFRRGRRCLLLGEAAYTCFGERHLVSR